MQPLEHEVLHLDDPPSQLDVYLVANLAVSRKKANVLLRSSLVLVNGEAKSHAYVPVQVLSICCVDKARSQESECGRKHMCVCT